MVSIFKKEVPLLIFLFLISSLIRFKINFSTEYFPGNNGAYYLLLNKDLLETGTFHYRDFPLLFYLQSFFAFILIKINLLNFNQAIDLVSRTFDSFVPTLSIIPAYLLSKKIIKDNKFQSLVIASIAIFHFSFFTLISDFQKNSLGILWLFWLMYFLFKINEKFSYKNLGYTFLFFVLVGLTHFGCFGVAILIVMINLLFIGLTKLTTKKIYKFLIVTFLLVIFSFCLVYLINPFRLYSLIEIIEKSFSKPIILMIIKNEPILPSNEILEITLTNIFSIAVLILLTKEKNIQNRNYFFTISIAALIIASPFLNYKIAQRLYFISYITIIPLFSFLIKYAKVRLTKNLVVYFSLVIILSSGILNIYRPVFSNMNKQLYADLINMKSKVSFNDKSIIISRHGLEYWLMWILKVNAIRKDEVTEDYRRWYKDIYIIRQKKLKPPFGPAGINGLPFQEPSITKNTKLIFTSDYFDLYKVLSMPKDFSTFKERL